MKELTEKQELVLDRIKQFIFSNGYPPTIRELCALCNVKSSATIFMHLKHLKEKEYIDFESKKPRTIVIIGD